MILDWFTSGYMKNLWALTLVKTQLSVTDSCETLLISFVALCSLEPMFHFYCPSTDTRHKSLPQHTLALPLLPPSRPNSILCESVQQHGCFVVRSGKMALNQRTTNHRRAVVQFQQSLVSTCRHTYAHTSQAKLSGLCSHQCVQLDRERKMGEIVEGVR